MPARFPLAGLVSAVSLVVFVWLAGQAVQGQTAGFDEAIRGAVHAFAFPGLTRAMEAITLFGSEVVLIPAGALALWRLVVAGRKQAAALLAISVAVGEALDQILKLLFHRPRPVAFFGYPDPETYSFPSGHAVAAFSFYMVLAAILTNRLNSKPARAGLWASAALLTAAIGFSRVYLGVHYPSDVAAGYAGAVVWIAGLERGYAIWRRRRAAGGESP